MTLVAEELPEPTPDLIAAVTTAGLPADDLGEPGRGFFRFEDDSGLIGYGGREQIGSDALIRSIVIADARRGAGLGAAVLSRLEARAAGEERAEGPYLLTTSAEAFFRRHGFAGLPRSEAPPAIAAFRQFSVLCPASAASMFKDALSR